MIRAFLIAAAALVCLGAAKVPTVDYRLGVEPSAAGPGMLRVEIRLRGDADGETRLALPDRYGSSEGAWRYLSDLSVRGATVTSDGPAFRLLRHRPNAKLTVVYRVRSAYDADPHWKQGLTYRGAVIRPDWFASRGDLVLAVPEGRDTQPARFRWGRLPKGWTAGSDLEHGAMGRPMTLRDVGQSVVMAGADVAIVRRPISRGELRVASLRSGPVPLEPLADQIAGAVSAQRSFWNDVEGPHFVAVIPLVRDGRSKVYGGNGLGDGFVLWSTPDQPDFLRWVVAHEYVHTWIADRVGRVDASQRGGHVLWFTEGVADFFTNRTMLRGSRWTAEDVVAQMSEVLKAYDDSPVRSQPNARVVADFWKDPNVYKLPHQRGALLALKWDEEIRSKTGGKVDLDDVILRMRDHYLQFPPGQGPDVVTGLVSAAWVTARLDLRPDIERYAVRGEAIPLPETMFDGCLEVRLFNRPAFDTGFDHQASIAAKKVSGVRRGGPAWNSGLRNGMALTAWSLQEGDTSKEVQFTVQPAGRRAKPRVYRYWPYGDERELSTRTLALKSGLTGEALAACGRKIGGL